MGKKTGEKIKLMVKKLGGYVLWLMVLVLAFSLVGNINKASKVKRDIQFEKEKVAKMEADNQKLEAQALQAQSVEFMEKEIRNKLGLAKDGETVVVLPDQEILRKLAPKPDNEENTLPDPNWKRWIKLFL